MFDVHDAVHDAFMTLPPYASIREGEVHSRGLGVRKSLAELVLTPCPNQASALNGNVQPLQPKDSRFAHPVGSWKEKILCLQKSTGDMKGAFT